MTKLLKTLNTISSIADCVPVISSLVNGGLLIYQRAHKVDQAANPINTGWKSDLKIFALSKNKTMAKASLVPVFGNIAALILKVKRQIRWKSGHTYHALYGSPVVESADPRSPMSKHGKEIISLYLAQNPHLPKEELLAALHTASRHGNREAFDIIFARADDLTSEEILHILAPCCASPEIATAVLDKFPEVLTSEHENEIFSSNLLPKTIAVFLERFDNLSRENLLKGLFYLSHHNDGLEAAVLTLAKIDNPTQKELLGALIEHNLYPEINEDTLYDILDRGQIDVNLACRILIDYVSRGRYDEGKMNRFADWVKLYKNALTEELIAQAERSKNPSVQLAFLKVQVKEISDQLRLNTD